MTSMRPAELKAGAAAVRLVGWKTRFMDKAADAYLVSASVCKPHSSSEYAPARQKNTMFSIPFLPLHPTGYLGGVGLLNRWLSAWLFEHRSVSCVYYQCCFLSIQPSKSQVRLMVNAGFPKVWSTATPYLGSKLPRTPLTESSQIVKQIGNLTMALDSRVIDM